jgi:hypothetical protein
MRAAAQQALALLVSPPDAHDVTHSNESTASRLLLRHANASAAARSPTLVEQPSVAVDVMARHVVHHSVEPNRYDPAHVLAIVILNVVLLLGPIAVVYMLCCRQKRAERVLTKATEPDDTAPASFAAWLLSASATVQMIFGFRDVSKPTAERRVDRQTATSALAPHVSQLAGDVARSSRASRPLGSTVTMLRIGGMACSHCSAAVEEALAAVDGVASATVRRARTRAAPQTALRPGARRLRPPPH